MRKVHSSRTTVAGVAAICLGGCDAINTLTDQETPAPCASARRLEGWEVSASVARDPSSELLVKRWETEQRFSTWFAVSFVLDTAEGPQPFLLIRHDYKSGEFVLRLKEKTHLRIPLKAQFAVSAGPLPPDVLDEIKDHPMQIEHTDHTGKWSVYQTTGLPEAIKAAEFDLETAKQKFAAGECSAA